MKRSVLKQVKGAPAIDGAGVHLVRVLGHATTEAFDPFLMLDSFDSVRPEDYTKGFPMHPHRGIETISYIAQGAMTHRDSLGHEDTVTSGEVQWMTAGSGILHEEKLPPSDRMLGVQLWLNLPQKDKMTAPAYQAVKDSEIQNIPIEGGTLRLLSGSYGEAQGHQGQYVPLDYYDLRLDAGARFQTETPENHAVVVFTLLGEIRIDGTPIAEKTAVLTTPGTEITIEVGDAPAEVLFLSAPRLNEPIAWYGPIVMNTQDELQKARMELRDGTFLKEGVDYDA